MDLIEGIETRRSIRAFKNTPIAEETLKEILKAAGNSPSYTNTQPWEVALVCGDKKEALRKIIYDLAEKSRSPSRFAQSKGMATGTCGTFRKSWGAEVGRPRR